MEIETAIIHNNENENCKFYFNVKVETASMLNYENRKCNYT